MIDNESPRRVAQSFEIRRISPDCNLYELVVDGEALPWEFVSVVSVEEDDHPTGLKFVHLQLIVDGDIAVDPSIEVTMTEDDFVHYTTPAGGSE